MLPKPFMTKASDSVWYVNPETESGTEFFTREQMLEQRRIGRLEALEEAAKVLERHGQEHAYSGEGADALTACANAIRALKNQSPLEK